MWWREMNGSAAFEDIGYRIEDGDMGYAGDTHQSFRAPRVARPGGRATEVGSALCRELVGQLRARFQQRGERAETGTVAPHAYQAAVAYVMQGRG
ncbi:hypothetical protein D7207_01630 [Burkholderia cepacia]|uniref:Uncharacterized protein n=2 Tax=Burkholderia cepacia TaxID=292 RepID=A0A8I1APA7_BURCE|nr:hypothetical protein [Burkholderia cepacia]MBA9942150.1 hypothetical protein [Burkholderia cepacia]MBA9990692.1 hypothetical protein [Burkholderia cepacia]MBB0014557.1 hypothetical protein [Burkholderia cepacia]MBB0050787.1 hypothetical protein [Burkholderia cepacia]MBB0051238.1 hypothetical protein [Burkholderia cepacia]